MMDKDKIVSIIEMRLQGIPYSTIAFKIGESETATKAAAQSAIKYINKEDLHKRTEQMLSQIPYTKVAKYMRDNAMTARDLARACGVSVQYMCMCLKDKDGMAVQNAARIAKATGLSLADVYTMESA